MINRRQFLQGSAALGIATLGLPAAAAAPFKLAYFETYSPFSFREGQTMQGIFIDLFDVLLGKRLGLTVHHAGYPWVRAQSLVQSGDEDAICTVATSARLEYALASKEPVLVAPIRIFARADNPLFSQLQAVSSLDELRQLNPQVLSYVGNGWAKEKLAGMRVDWGGTFAESVRKLIAGRGDVMIENSLSMQYTLKNMEGNRQVRMLPNTLESSEFRLLISRHSPHAGLLPAFDETLRKFKRETGYAQIFDRYGIKL